jgi:elongation factor P
MIRATDLKNGTAFEYFGKPYKVIKYSLIKMGRGGATVKVNARNLENGATNELAFSSNLSFEEVELEKRRLQYMYKDSKTAFFINPATYEQVEIPLSVLGDDILFVKEGENMDILFMNEKAISCDLPPKVTLKIIQTDPGVKGNSASNMYKSATVENGMSIKVPLFVNQGDSVVVDTRTGEYVERAK